VVVCCLFRRCQWKKQPKKKWKAFKKLGARISQTKTIFFFHKQLEIEKCWGSATCKRTSRVTDLGSEYTKKYHDLFSRFYFVGEGQKQLIFLTHYILTPQKISGNNTKKKYLSMNVRNVVIHIDDPSSTLAEVPVTLWQISMGVRIDLKVTRSCPNCHRGPCQYCHGKAHTQIWKSLDTGMFRHVYVPCTYCNVPSSHDTPDKCRELLCNVCEQGSGTMTLLHYMHLRIPAGTSTEERLAFLQVPLQGGECLYVHLKLQEHPYYRRVGCDLVVKTPFFITLHDAFQGFSVELPPLGPYRRNQRIRVACPGMALPKTLWRATGRGLPLNNVHSNTDCWGRCGDIYMEFMVRGIPSQSLSMNTVVRNLGRRYHPQYGEQLLEKASYQTTLDLWELASDEQVDT
jgi:DnaJ-class molecular chaperone